MGIQSGDRVGSSSISSPSSWARVPASSSGSFSPARPSTWVSLKSRAEGERWVVDRAPLNWMPHPSPGSTKSIPQAAGRRRRHALLVDRAWQQGQGWENPSRLHDERLHQLVHPGLQGHRVLPSGHWQQCWPEAYGQVVWVHHVLITILGQTEGTCKSQAGNSLPSVPGTPHISCSCLLRSTHWLRKVKR